MKPLIIFLAAVVFVFSTFSTVALAGCGCPNKHYKHYKHYRVQRSCERGFYAPGYCECGRNACSGCYEQTCYSGHYYTCRTELSYHSGRNSAVVEVCR